MVKTILNLMDHKLLLFSGLFYFTIKGHVFLKGRFKYSKGLYYISYLKKIKTGL